MIRIQKIKINDEALFEIRYVQYFTPQQLLPLFHGGKKKMQTRIQLIDAVDSNGNKLSKRQSMRLLRNAIKSQSSDVDVMLMPTMEQSETDFMVKNLKRATTLACGRTSHKVSRKYYKDTSKDIIVNVSDIDINNCEELKPIAKGLKILTKLVRKHKKIVINKMYNNLVNSHITDKENNLKAQLLLSKLNAILSKRLERQKNNAFNQMKIHTVQSLSIERSTGENANSNISSGSKNYKLNRIGTTSDFRVTQSTNYKPGCEHNSGSITANSSINRNSNYKRQY